MPRAENFRQPAQGGTSKRTQAPTASGFAKKPVVALEVNNRAARRAKAKQQKGES